MTRHADLLIARSRDDRLSETETVALETHLGQCDRCRELDADLRRSEALLRRDLPKVELPPLTEVRGERLSRAPVALAAIAAVIVGLIVGSGLLAVRSDRDARGAAGSTGGSTVSAGSAVQSNARLLAVVWATGASAPPGGKVLFGWFNRLVVLSGEGGELISHQVRGVGVGTASFDGDHHVAFWRADAPGRPPFELVIWDVSTQQDVVVARIEGANPIWPAPLWTPDGRGIAYASGVPASPALAPATSSPNSMTRLFSVDIAGYSVREVPAAPGDIPSAGVFYDGEVIGGISGTQYKTIDARSGALLRTLALPSGPLTVTRANSDGVVFGVVTRFEAASGPIVVWRGREAQTLRTVDAPGVAGVLFWPGRPELMFSRDGDELQAIDYVSGAERRPGSGLGSLVPLSFDSAGSALVARASDGRLELLTVTSGALTSGTRLQLPAEVEVIAMIHGP